MVVGGWWRGGRGIIMRTDWSGGAVLQKEGNWEALQLQEGEIPGPSVLSPAHTSHVQTAPTRTHPRTVCNCVRGVRGRLSSGQPDKHAGTHFHGRPRCTWSDHWPQSFAA